MTLEQEWHVFAQSKIDVRVNSLFPNVGAADIIGCAKHANGRCIMNSYLSETSLSAHTSDAPLKCGTSITRKRAGELL
jgi:hypothetical protein